MEWLEAGRPSFALPELNHFLDQAPDHRDARLTRSRVLARLDQLQAAVQDLSFVISRTPVPTPEIYLERAQLLVRRGPEFVNEALRGIDDAIKHLGPLVTLSWFAIEVEAEYGRHQSALARFEALPADLRSQPVWLSRRGALLQTAGRPREARMAYGEARSAIARLPQTRQATRSMADLAARLDRLLIQPDSESNP